MNSSVKTKVAQLDSARVVGAQFVMSRSHDKFVPNLVHRGGTQLHLYDNADASFDRARVRNQAPFGYPSRSSSDTNAEAYGDTSTHSKTDCDPKAVDNSTAKSETDSERDAVADRFDFQSDVDG